MRLMAYAKDSDEDTYLTTYEKNDYCTTSPTEHTIDNKLEGFLYLIHQSHTSFTAAILYPAHC